MRWKLVSGPEFADLAISGNLAPSILTNVADANFLGVGLVCLGGGGDKVSPQ